MTLVNVIFHSVSGHTFRMAEALSRGVTDVPRCQARLLRIPEPAGLQPITMPGLEKRHHDFSQVPEATIQDLANCDGLAIGTAVYWVNMSYATKLYLDSAAKLWDLSTPDRPVQTAPELAGKTGHRVHWWREQWETGERLRPSLPQIAGGEALGPALKAVSGQ